WPGSPAPARPYADSDAEAGAIDADPGAVSAVIAGIAVVRGGVITGIPVISAGIDPAPADQAAVTPPAGDGFTQAGFRGGGANSGRSAGRHRLGAADRQKRRRADRRRRGRSQKDVSHVTSPSGKQPQS